MAVVKIATIQRWAGHSGDLKPGDLPDDPNPPEGSGFHAVDTGDEYVYHYGMWEPDLRLARAVQIAAHLP
jgi:hypothetical protein